MRVRRGGALGVEHALEHSRTSVAHDLRGERRCTSPLVASSAESAVSLVEEDDEGLEDNLSGPVVGDGEACRALRTPGVAASPSSMGRSATVAAGDRRSAVHYRRLAVHYRTVAADSPRFAMHSLMFALHRGTIAAHSTWIVPHCGTTVAHFTRIEQHYMEKKAHSARIAHHYRRIAVHSQTIAADYAPGAAIPRRGVTGRTEERKVGTELLPAFRPS